MLSMTPVLAILLVLLSVADANRIKILDGMKSMSPQDDASANVMLTEDQWNKLPPEDSNGYQRLLGALQGSSTLALPPGVLGDTQIVLKCEQYDESISCDDPCTFGVSFEMQKDENGLTWCHIPSVLYHTYNCKDRSKKYSGRDVVNAAVKTCEAMGYDHQYLEDGARSKCMMYEDLDGEDYYWEPLRLNTGNSVMLRSSGLFTNGMAFYHKQQGFFPHFTSGSIDLTAAMENWCAAADRALTTTVGDATSEPCTSADGSFKSNAQVAKDWRSSEVVEAAGCSDDMALGSCFRRLVKLDKEQKSPSSCKALTLTQSLMDNWNGEDVHPSNHVDSLTCAHRSRSVAVSLYMGRPRRYTHGFKVKFGGKAATIYPDTPLNVYCNKADSAVIGEQCVTDSMCASGSCSGKGAGKRKVCCTPTPGVFPTDVLHEALEKHYKNGNDAVNEQAYVQDAARNRPELAGLCCQKKIGKVRVKLLKNRPLSLQCQ